jgi:hypothetical protein
MASETAKAAAPWPPAVILAARIAIVVLVIYNFYSYYDFPKLWNWYQMKLTEDGSTHLQLIWANVFSFVINPLCMLAAAVLAFMGRRLLLAGLLAAMPLWHMWGSIALFAFAVFVYGYGP